MFQFHLLTIFQLQSIEITRWKFILGTPKICLYLLKSSNLITNPTVIKEDAICLPLEYLSINNFLIGQLRCILHMSYAEEK